MKLSKAMIMVLAKVIRGTNTLESLAEALNKSVNRMSEIIKELEKEGFVVKCKSFKTKGSRFVINLTNTNYTIKIKELIFQYPTIKFEDILADSKLLFLVALSEDWMNINIASKLSKVSKYMIYRYRAMLKNRGIIIQDGDLYKINEKAWPSLKEFLIDYKNFSTVNGTIKWKYNDETLFEIDNETLIKGTITGFAKYKDYGVKVNNISILCKLPKTNLLKEEVFVHSLFEVNDPRTLHLALTFYLKNKLNYKKILPIAIKYGKYTMFKNLINLLKTKEEKIKLENLPEFNRTDFRRIIRMYGVNNV